MEKNKTEIKGYNLSIDYKRLWDLIQDGNRVPAWILYCNDYDHPIYDLVEVKLAYASDRYSIGVRGHSYDTFDSDFKSFEMNCERLELRFAEQSADYHNVYLQGLKDKDFELSDKKYTEEDMLKCWNTAFTDAMNIDSETYKPIFYSDFINSLNKQE